MIEVVTTYPMFHVMLCTPQPRTIHHSARRGLFFMVPQDMEYSWTDGGDRRRSAPGGSRRGEGEQRAEESERTEPARTIQDSNAFKLFRVFEIVGMEISLAHTLDLFSR